MCHYVLHKGKAQVVDTCAVIKEHPGPGERDTTAMNTRERQRYKTTGPVPLRYHDEVPPPDRGTEGRNSP
jgi:hypothetical protein